VVAVVLVVVAGLAAGVGQQHPDPAASVTPASAAGSSAPRPAVMMVAVKKARFQTLHHDVAVTGTVNAREELPVAAEAQGLRIESVLVDEGSQVTRGQVLVRLDDSGLRAQLAQLQARLRGALAAEVKARQPNRPQEVEGLRLSLKEAQASAALQRANLQQAEATLKNDQENAARYRRLVAVGAVAVADARGVFTTETKDEAAMMAAHDQVRVAETGVAEAANRLNLGELGGNPQDSEVAAAAAAEVRANIEQIEVQLAQTVVVAPDDGLIIKRDATIGDITAGKALFTMVRRNQLEVRAQVPAAELFHVKTGDPVEVTGYGKTVTGRVWKITPQVDPSTLLGVVRVALPANAGFLPGMFVQGAIAEAVVQAVTVPMKAALGAADERFVFVYRDGAVHKRPVHLGQTYGEDVIVTSGITTQDQVVVDGAAFLNDGDIVAVPEGATP
jgi:HlyD family secretion protein